MSTSFARRLLESATTTRPIREIDNHYHVAMIADDTSELVEYSRASFRLQAASAAANLHMFGEISSGQAKTNDLLQGMSEDLSDISEGVAKLNETTEEGFRVLAQRLLQQHTALLAIADLLRRPYQTQALELRNEADKWLRSGMGHTGREMGDDFTDAMRLLREVTKNPIGNQDYVVWFQIGWLLWKHDKKIADAEEAFYRAARLSSNNADLYHALSVRHQSQMQYLQGRHEDAYRTIQKLLPDCRDSDVLYDAARFAAKTGHTSEASMLLDRCIELEPTIYITMFSEEDFRS